MQQLFSTQNKEFLPPVNKKEDVLRDFLWDNREKLFQKYNFIFIGKEFSLKGPVHDLDNSGRIDILAYNKDTRRFVIFELKKDDGKYNGLYQATKYRSYIKSHFAEVYLAAIKKCNDLPPFDEGAIKKKAEIIYITKGFTQSIINEAKEDENLITLIKYNWFGNDYLFLDYVHSATDEKVSPETKGEGDTQKPSWKPLTQDKIKIWNKIKHVAKKQEGKAEELPDGPKKEIMKKYFLIVNKCIDTEDAQTLYDERPGLLKSLAKLILDLEQSTPDQP